MPENRLKTRLVALLRTKQNAQKEIEKLQNQLVQQLCPKGKQSCEPEHCALRITRTCQFLKEWRSILAEANARSAAD